MAPTTGRAESPAPAQGTLAARSATTALDHPPVAGTDAPGIGAADRDMAERISAVTSGWDGVLARLSLSPQTALRIARRAIANGTPFQAELLASGVVAESRLFRAMAAELSLDFGHGADPGRLLIPARDALVLLREPFASGPVMVEEVEHPPSFLVAPQKRELAELADYVRRFQGIASRLRVVAPTALRAALLARAGEELSRLSLSRLFDALPHCSARIVANAWQGALFGGLAVALPIALAFAPGETSLVLHACFSLFFLSCVVLRLAAIGVAGPLRHDPLPPLAAEELPVYSVLVALYREAEIVPELLVALGRIEWPRSKLDVKLVCEEDDHETLEAIRAQELRPYIEVVAVPRKGPRTKPKALAYALCLVRGDFVVLYDAEDRPHPKQLLEAWSRFRDGSPSLACLQAPLVVTNGGKSWIARLFAFEYAALFRGLIPFLASANLLFPLGGTSNHFRREALEKIGGWDPYNVTEDADLGVRLRRFGFRTEVLSRPTLEDGPDRIGTWIPQRTRWFKGWMQTWLVHMRNPVRLARELGAGSFVVAQIVFAGMVVSALAHPVMMATMLYFFLQLIVAGQVTPAQSLLFLIDSTSILLGYLAFLALGFQALSVREKSGFWQVLLWVPVYWLLMSAAAWRAVWKILRHPFEWEKTPHPRRHVS